MAEKFESQTGYSWNHFIRKHVAIFVVFIAAAILAAVGAVYVFVWFTGEAQTTGLVPSVLNVWTMNNLVLFILHAVFWELVLIGIPVAVAAIIGWLWWRNQPDKPKSEKHNRSRDAGGAVSLFLFIAFAIKVYVDGNWYVPISSFTLDYVVGSIVTILIWIAAIFAIPAIIVLIWWITSGRKKHP
ncbi:MAG: hypothetical protein ACFCUE_15115 [Candidatus Bathyarchaeia archaeon]|jgi:hypothetical protein